MSKDKPVTILPDGGPDVTSAGVNWNEVHGSDLQRRLAGTPPDFAPF